MIRSPVIAILVVAMLAGAGILCGCNTIKGVGADLEAAGDALSAAAKSRQQQL